MASRVKRRSCAWSRRRRERKLPPSTGYDSRDVLHPRRAHEGRPTARPAGPRRAATPVARAAAALGVEPDARTSARGACGERAAPGRRALLVAPSCPPRRGPPAGQATPAPATPPVAAARHAAPPEASRLRLEALIYADVPTERMVFINGRRYREGDAIDGRLRIEEIREDGVELSDQGR